MNEHNHTTEESWCPSCGDAMTTEEANGSKLCEVCAAAETPTDDMSAFERLFAMQAAIDHELARGKLADSLARDANEAEPIDFAFPEESVATLIGRVKRLSGSANVIVTDPDDPTRWHVMSINDVEYQPTTGNVQVKITRDGIVHITETPTKKATPHEQA
ncbi:MAG: hypothetical protein SOI13_01485 [Bifidobacterium mongoliense]|jgi:hypothetical protein|uniref:hypothetical protein n=1 Tax=Bifidobacterium mongoliense TaxID=518643 RepID=UPI002F34F939